MASLSLKFCHGAAKVSALFLFLFLFFCRMRPRISVCLGIFMRNEKIPWWPIQKDEHGIAWALGGSEDLVSFIQSFV